MILRLALLFVLALVPPARAAEPAARDLFGEVKAPSADAPRPIGSYAKGCMAGAVALPEAGDAWQTMRPSRNRNWGDPGLVLVLEHIAREARADGWPGLLVGDMGQPRGGPMLTGHASHQIGLDADIWLTPKPTKLLSPEERESLGAISMLVDSTRTLDRTRFTAAHAAVIRRAALQPEVTRIFVHPAIKQRLCEVAGTDRAWLTKVRPWWGHDDHFHIRIACPKGDEACEVQEPPPAGDGCGSDLAWWLTDEPWKPTDKAPPKPLTMADLPKACGSVLAAP